MQSSTASWESLLDPQEKTSYVELFRTADTEGKGVLLKDEAMEFFKKSNIWEAADRDNKGFLTDQEFCIAIKLIACAQHGILPASPVLTTTVPLPQLEGVHVRPAIPNTNRPSTPRSNPPPSASPNLQAASPGSDTLLPDERAHYISLFQSSGPVDGILIGEKAKEIFLRSNLQPSTLHQIWSLADTRKSGTLNQTEFIIAMHYITRVLAGNSLPSSLPASIYAAAASGRMKSPVMSNQSPTIRRQDTMPFTGGQSHHPGRGDFDISNEEFNKYKKFFEQLDTNHTGFISGGDAVVFFRHSKLSESDLARIWDLADTSQTGQLNVQQFAVAMHLINRRISGGQIPTTLTDTGLARHPSFMNTQTQATNAASTQANANQSFDLLGLSSNEPSAPSAPSAPTQPSLPSVSQPVAATDSVSNIGLQRTELESTLTSIRNETQNQIARNDQLRSQVDNEAQAIRQLQETIAREKESLEALKRAATDAERELEQHQNKKNELTQELRVLKQEHNHYNQRLEHAQNELQKSTISSPVSAKEQPVSASSPNNMFSLSTAPAGDLFSSVNQHATGSPSSSPAPKKGFDPFEGFKKGSSSSATSSPIATLNRLKEESDNKQQARSGTPNVDISDIEAKFPDLSTMEHSFQPTSPANVSAPPPASSSTTSTPTATPKQSSASIAYTQQQPTSPFLHHNHSISQQQQQQPLTRQATLSPSQAKSVAKYGFDLSAFEDDEGPSPAITNTAPPPSGSLKDDLHSLISSPATTGSTPQQQQPASQPTNTSFDDIFNVNPNNNKPAPPEKKPTFDEMFFS
ncbi:EF-hand [Lichtheimia hyalospora FSU 10163]|nr:EF-hand [Lichtheimia hyalospora FSU 10163]